MLDLSKQEISPALKSHLEAQFSFLTDLSKKMFDSAKKLGELNMQVAQIVMEETLNTSHQLMEANTSGEYLTIAASQAQPVAEKACVYQQHLNNIAANMQVEVSKTAQQHVPETTRTAAAVAEEVVRRGTEETDKATQRQKAVFEKMARQINTPQPTEQDSSTLSSQQQPANKQPASQQF